ncbi:TPA: ETX/MTX2 family pore-forming toxin [Enterococcus faecalis]|nr:ETX/MTX2 family pore-forming toxin [Enterococcus faecalis]EGO8651910.1 hypothetical protein [Enterococcus faecalis]EKJ3581692.1 ETX/MTX2 family pore-forming toxin [Enterococcus faecalis]EKQ3613756.1 ETX/MTX2 family pore-forming toxin [Enterococcus faecalis]
MKKNKKIILALLCCGSLSFGITPITAFSAEKADNQSIENQSAVIDDIQYYMNSLAYRYYAERLAGTKAGGGYTLDREPEKFSGSIDKFVLDENKITPHLSLSDIEPLFIGENTFENNTDLEQVFNTAVFEHTVTETMDTSTTKGFHYGADVVFNIPLLIDGIKLLGNFNSSDPGSVSTSKTKKLTAAAQPVKVPPHKTYRAEVMLMRSEYGGTVQYEALGINPWTQLNANGYLIDVTGVPHVHNFQYHIKGIDAWSKISDDGKRPLNLNFEGENVRIKNEAKVSGIAGSRLDVRIWDEDTQTLVKTIELK